MNGFLLSSANCIAGVFIIVVSIVGLTKKRCENIRIKVLRLLVAVVGFCIFLVSIYAIVSNYLLVVGLNWKPMNDFENQFCIQIPDEAINKKTITNGIQYDVYSEVDDSVFTIIVRPSGSQISVNENDRVLSIKEKALKGGYLLTDLQHVGTHIYDLRFDKNLPSEARVFYRIVFAKEREIILILATNRFKRDDNQKYFFDSLRILDETQ